MSEEGWRGLGKSILAVVFPLPAILGVKGWERKACHSVMFGLHLVLSMALAQAAEEQPVSWSMSPADPQKVLENGGGLVLMETPTLLLSLLSPVPHSLLSLGS